MRKNVWKRVLGAALACLLAVLDALPAGAVRGVSYFSSAAAHIVPQFTQVPILMYHNLTEDENDPAIGQDTLWVGQFRRHLELLEEEGFVTVSLGQLIDYARKGSPLPEKAVCITFDDGYSSTYQLAFPLLQEFDAKATVFPIGVSVGKDTYKDTGLPITPHFTWEQAREMVQSGLVSIQSHTYDMHQWAEFETAGGGECLRPNVLRQPWETPGEYARALQADLDRSRQDIEENVGEPVVALSYPGGSYDELSESLLQEFGILCTLTIHPGKAQLLRRVPQCLYGLNRFYVKASTTEEEFLSWVG